MPVYFWFPVLASLGIGFMLMNLPPVATQFMEMFGVGYGGFAFILSATFWTHSLIQVPSGLIIDRLGTLRSLLLSGALCVLAGLLPLIAPQCLTLAICMRMIIGFATGMLFLAAVKLTKLLCPPQYMGRAQALQGASFSLGSMLPYLVLPPFASFGWIAAYAIGAMFPALLLLSLIRVPLEPLKAEASSATLTEVWSAVKVIALSRHIWYLGCCHGFSFGTITAIGSWLPAILADSKPGSTLAEWSLITSLVLLVGTTARVFSGDLSRLRPRPVLLPYLVLCIAVFYALLGLAPSPAFVLAAAICLAAACGSTYSSIFTLAIDVSEPAYVATAVGFMSMVANLVNVVLTIFFGNIREYTGSFSIALIMSGLAAACVCLWGRKLTWGKV